MASKQNQLESIVREYRLAGRAWPTTSHAIARWAMANRRWEQPPIRRSVSARGRSRGR
jgi:hypothetical protein